MQTLQGSQTQVMTTVPINIGGMTLALPVMNNLAGGGAVQLIQAADGSFTVANSNQLVTTTAAAVSGAATGSSGGTITTVAGCDGALSDGTQLSSVAGSDGGAERDSQNQPSEQDSQMSQANGLQGQSDPPGTIQQVIVGQMGNQVLQQIQIQPQNQIQGQPHQIQTFQLGPGGTLQPIQAFQNQQVASCSLLLSPNCCHKVGSTESSRMSLYAIALRFPFTENKGPNPNHEKHPQTIIPPPNFTVGTMHSGR
uniref:Uncharacterized protein n=1 Tax=Hucho hucho TaxID=62062 RepID=A0A4W5LEJ2_9TELE